MAAGLLLVTVDVQPRVSAGDIPLPAMAAAMRLLAATVVVDPLTVAVDHRMAAVRRTVAGPTAEAAEDTVGDFTPGFCRRSKVATLYPAVERLNSVPLLFFGGRSHSLVSGWWVM